MFNYRKIINYIVRRGGKNGTTLSMLSVVEKQPSFGMEKGRGGIGK